MYIQNNYEIGQNLRSKSFFFRFSDSSSLFSFLVTKISTLPSNIKKIDNNNNENNSNLIIIKIMVFNLKFAL